MRTSIRRGCRNTGGETQRGANKVNSEVNRDGSESEGRGGNVGVG